VLRGTEENRANKPQSGWFCFWAATQPEHQAQVLPTRARQSELTNKKKEKDSFKATVQFVTVTRVGVHLVL
jgi:hypothetical protein